MAWCHRCNKTYDGLASTGLCPLCGGTATAWPGSSLGLGILVLAGLIEGFVTPMSGLGPWAKIGIGILPGTAFWVWLLVPRRDHA